MLENRPIVVSAIGYILGIIMGLYCKISIVFLYLIALIIYLILKKPRVKKFKLISFRRYFRYVKIIFTKKVIVIIAILSIISNTITIMQNIKYANLYANTKEVKVVATIVSDKKEKQYWNIYKIKVYSVNGENKYKNTYLYIKVKKNVEELKVGDKIRVIGDFESPEGRRNYRGFDYKEYLKTLKIYGTVNSKSIEKLESEFDLKIEVLKMSNTIFNKIKNIILKKFEPKIANVLLGITLGYTDEIEEDIVENFRESNMAHILAVSGMHVGFLILAINFIGTKIVGKRMCKILTAVVLVIYMFITGFSPSIVRACIMAELTIGAFIFYRKNDVWQNISFAVLILLIYNPFLIESTGFLLTFVGTIRYNAKAKKHKKCIWSYNFCNTYNNTNYCNIF